MITRLWGIVAVSAKIHDVYIYSHPKVDRIFFGGCGIYVGIMLDVGHLKINR